MYKRVDECEVDIINFPEKSSANSENNNPFSGLGQAHETVRTAATAFLFSSEQVLDKLSIAKVYPPPNIGQAQEK